MKRAGAVSSTQSCNLAFTIAGRISARLKIAIGHDLLWIY